jgi:hypothetical protein
MTDIIAFLPRLFSNLPGIPINGINAIYVIDGVFLLFVVFLFLHIIPAGWTWFRLSMRRAETVLCSLFELPKSNEIPLSVDDRKMVRDLFLVGGYSFNNGQGKTEAEMRRVEFKLDFLGFEEQAPAVNQSGLDNFGQCR